MQHRVKEERVGVGRKLMNIHNGCVGGISTENQRGVDKYFLSNTEHIHNEILVISPKIINMGILPTPTAPLQQN